MGIGEARLSKLEGDGGGMIVQMFGLSGKVFSADSPLHFEVVFSFQPPTV